MSSPLDEIEVRFYYDGRPTEVTFWRGPVGNCYEATPSSLCRCLKKAQDNWDVGVVVAGNSVELYFREYLGALAKASPQNDND